MAANVEKTAIEAPQNVLDLLERLHKLSLDQEIGLKDPNGEWETLKQWLKDNQAKAEKRRDEIMVDKFIALDADKATFVYSLIRATGALNVVEAGTSFGVSTIYLALAVGQNAKAAGKKPGEAKVIGTEFEPTKAAQAKKYWNEAGESVEPWIELREGELRETLKKDLPTIDFVLFDIWTPLVIPTLDLLEPRFRPGTVLVADNVVSSAEGYAELFARIKGPGSKYKTLTLPYDGGLEMVTYWG